MMKPKPEAKFIVKNPHAHVVYALGDQMRVCAEAKPRALASLELIDDALKLLKGRAGERAKSTRDVLLAQRAPIASVVDLVEALGGTDFSGPLARDLAAHIATTYVALDAAKKAKELATRDTVSDAILEIEKCEADVRQIDRDLDQALAMLTVPPMPNAADFELAQLDTEALQALPAKNPSARHVHRAIQRALDAPESLAALFVVFETKPDHELVRWRERGLAERG